jgi:hypothetical protein
LTNKRCLAFFLLSKYILITCRNFQLSTFSKAGIPNCLSFSLTIAFESDHSMAKDSLNKVENVMTDTTADRSIKVHT